MRKPNLCFYFVTGALCASALTLAGQESVQQAQATNTLASRAYTAVKAAATTDVETMKSQAAAGASVTLPLWTFFVESSRDDNGYTGVMVGQDPFTVGGSVSVPTYVVPLVLKTNTIGVSLSSKGIISTKRGVTTFDPSIADNACLTAPNNVPLTLFGQSPIIQPATFDFGGTIVGTTQYVDAFQRGNFWTVLGADGGGYHVLLGPVKILAPIAINVPAADGTTLPSSDFPSCGPLGIVDINWFDTYLDQIVLPALISQGINPSNFPIFLVHNLVWASPVTDLNTCCILGYHGTTGLPIQTYAPADFDSTGLFGTSFGDTVVLSHEVAEWMNDPFGNNPTPAWGHTGQVAGCQANLEVGDPLSGTEAPRIAMPNGFTYHLQELAFFSWFFGAPSIGINGWYSDNGTFLTDAGPPCISSSSASSSAPWWARH